MNLLLLRSDLWKFRFSIPRESECITSETVVVK